MYDQEVVQRLHLGSSTFDQEEDNYLVESITIYNIIFQQKHVWVPPWCTSEVWIQFQSISGSFT